MGYTIEELQSGPKGRTCVVCKLRPATCFWSNGGMDAARGYAEPRCEVCVLEEQIENAEAAAAHLPTLRARLVELLQKEEEEEEEEAKHG